MYRTKKVTFINHASMLIQSGDSFILTDPWNTKPAFGSWLSVPPPIYNPTYFIALAKSNPNFTIVVSHGHDDHLDDELLKLFPLTTRCMIPKYQSVGIRKRLERCGLENIIEFDNTGVQVNGVVYKSYIFKDISLDDAFITIATRDFIVGHGNDNWQPLPPNELAAIKQDFAKYGYWDRLFMSQTNIADGFPLIYDNYTDSQKRFLAKQRQDKMILSSLQNAVAVRASAFISYAGLSLPFVADRPELVGADSRAYCKSIAYLKNLAQENGIKSSIVLDMVPGDSYNFIKVDKLFGHQYYDHETIREASVEYYKGYNITNACDTYKAPENELSAARKKELLTLFLDGFKNFVDRKFQKTDQYQQNVFQINFSFSDGTLEEECSLSTSPEATVQFTFEKNILENLLDGKINWENTYIGYESSVDVGSDYNIGSLIRWLSMYGYVYQQRIYPNA